MNLGPEELKIGAKIDPPSGITGFSWRISPGQHAPIEVYERYIRRMNREQFMFLSVGMKVRWCVPGLGTNGRMGHGIITHMYTEAGYCTVQVYQVHIQEEKQAGRYTFWPDWTKPLKDKIEYMEPCVLREWHSGEAFSSEVINDPEVNPILKKLKM